MSVKERMFEAKIKKSKEAIKKAFDKWHPKIGVAWNTDMASTANLYLARQVDENIPVLFSDTTQHFKETYKHRDRIAEEWSLNLINVVPEVSYEDVKGDTEGCCRVLKTLPALKKIKELGLGAVMSGIRWSEHPARAGEEYVSKREQGQMFSHFRVHPLLHWAGEDILHFTKAYNIPHNPLYDKGYRSIGCAPCTKPAPPNFQEKFERAQDKEKIMGRLRALGYW